MGKKKRKSVSELADKGISTRIGKRFEIQTPDTATKDRLFAFGLTAIYAVLLLVCVLHHEMWRDEIDIWLYGKYINSIAKFFYIIRWEPHPGLWYIFVTALAKLFPRPSSIQFFHVIIASSAAYVFLRYAPLPRLLKGLFIFGFFPFFEYGVISRGYAPGILLAFLVCALFPDRNKKLLTIAVLLFAMANCSAFGLLLSVALALTICLTWITDLYTQNGLPVSPWKALVFIGIVVGGSILSWIQIQTPGDTALLSASANHYFNFELSEVVSIVSRIYLYDFAKESPFHGVLISMLLMGIVIAAFIKKPIALFAYLFATVSMLAAIYVRQMGYLWHMGQLIYPLVIGLWLAGYYPLKPNKKPGPNFDRFTYWFFAAIFAFQVFPSAISAYLDYKHPYSCGEEAAAYIKTNGLQNMVIAGDIYYTLSTVSGYIEKPVYYLTCGKDGVFSWTWVQLTPHQMTGYEFARRTWLLSRKSKEGVLLVMSYPLREDFCSYLGAKLIRSFEDEKASFIQDEPAVGENFWLYIVKPDHRNY